MHNDYPNKRKYNIITIINKTKPLNFGPFCQFSILMTCQTLQLQPSTKRFMHSKEISNCI